MKKSSTDFPNPNSLADFNLCKSGPRESVEENFAAGHGAQGDPATVVFSGGETRFDSHLMQQPAAILYRLELVWVRGAQRGVLYVYGPDESGFSQVFGTLEELREIARTRYPEAEIHETPLDGMFEVTDKNLATDEHGFSRIKATV